MCDFEHLCEMIIENIVVSSTNKKLRKPKTEKKNYWIFVDRVELNVFAFDEKEKFIAFRLAKVNRLQAMHD